MRQEVNITNNKFGMLTAMYRSNPGEQPSKWLFRCDCGVSKEIAKANVVAGHVRSCGCLVGRVNKQYPKNSSHGGTGTRLHDIWRGMNKRCHQVKSGAAFDKYRGRGIVVCADWRDDFANFRDWALANSYADNLTIERKDNDGNYEPDNCVWVSWQRQANNRRNTRFETINGKTQSLSDWCREYGIDHAAVQGRLKMGWPLEKALTTPKKWFKKKPHS